MKQQDTALGTNTITAGKENGRLLPFSFFPERYSRLFSANGINNRVFLGVIFLYHVALIFQGIDLLDEGFHVTFYQRILNDPTSVQYGFFYWFSGIIGGFFLKLAPGLGLWGLRLAGAMVSLATIFISYRMVRKTMPLGIWQISIVILALYINNEPKDIHYNTLSALLYFLSAWLIFEGLKKGKGIYLLLCGAAISLNFFTRLPNILGVGLVLAIIYEGIIQKRNVARVIGNLSYFISGFFITTLVVLGIMKAAGHLEPYQNSIKFLFSLTTTSDKKDGLAGSYSMLKLMLRPARQHAISVSLIVLLSAFLVIGKILADEARKLKFQRLRPDLVIWGVLSAAVLAIVFTDRVVLKDLTYLFTGFCTIAAIIYILGNYSYEEKLISFLGLFIMLVHPLGSAPGIMTVMIYSLWISFPMAMKLLHNLFSRDITFDVKWGNVKATRIMLEESFLRKALLWMGTVIVIICIRHIFTYPYFFDKHNRMSMFSGINSENMRFIYTSEGRARILNELLAESEKYVKKGDPVLAYDAFPMYHFMTETKPFLSSSAPLYFTTGHFENEMRRAVEKSGLPVVIRQKIWMVHEGSTWPEIIYTGENLQDGLSKGRNEIFDQFLKVNNYEETWSNQVFSILLPGRKKNPAQ